MSDPFELFGVEPAYDLDLGALEARYRELSRTLHPDRHAGHPATERRQALGLAIEVNDAWRVLRDPVRRGEALLARLGIVVNERGGGPTRPELLMEMMEFRETLADARGQGDAEAVLRLSGQVRERQAQLMERLNESFRAALQGAKGGGWPGAKLVEELDELRYYRKFLDDAAQIEDELF